MNDLNIFISRKKIKTIINLQFSKSLRDFEIYLNFIE